MAGGLDRATANETLDALADGDISSVELLDALLDRVERHNPSTNAVVAFDVEGARAEARAADDARASGHDAGPLHGMPMTLKDTLETAGLVTTAGSPMLADHVPAEDADVVRGLKDAGAIIYGKTNVPFMAADHQSYNDVYGLTRNAWDPERTVGGSSGGAACAVATGMSLLEVGSDIGGSIRVPAHFNGIYGLKPSFGVVSQRGHIPGPPGALSAGDLSVVGPLARSVADLRLVLDAISAVGAFQGTPGAALPRPDAPADITTLRFGLWSDDAMAPIASTMKARIEAFATKLAGAGARVDTDRRPGPSDQLHETYLGLLLPIMMAGLPAEIFEGLVAKRASGDPVALESASVRHGPAPHREWLLWAEARAQAQAAWAAMFEEVDAVIMPVCQTVAFAHNTERSYQDRVTEVDGVARPYDELLFWQGLATMPYLPSVVVPLGLVDGMPCGVQIVGPMWSDHRLLDIAQTVTDVANLSCPVPPEPS